MSQDQTAEGALHDDFLMCLSEAIRQRRKVKGISQEELADRSGLHRTYISDIERAARNIAIMNLRRIAKALEMEVSELLLEAEGLSKRKTEELIQRAKN